jgi:hypothetical protein
MLAGIYNMTCQQGATFSRVITNKYPDPNSPPSDPTYLLYNLTGFQARMQVRRTVDSATVLVTLTNSNGGIILGGVDGTIEITISAADTALLTSSGVYDLEIVSGTGVVSRVLQGEWRLSPEVTR